MKFIKDALIGDVRISMFVAEIGDDQTRTPFEILMSWKGTRIQGHTQYVALNVANIKSSPNAD